MKTSPRTSYILYILAMTIYGTIGIFRKYIPLSSGLLVFARGLIGGLFLLGFVKCRGGSFRLGVGKKAFWLLVLTGFALGFNWILLFEAYRFTSVSVATLCYYMQPTILILLSPALFKEKLTVKKGICALIAVGGMVCVSGVIDASHTLGTADITGICLGLGAAVLYAFIIILNKKTPTPNVYGKTMVELFSSTVILVPYLLLTEDFTTISLDPVAIIMVLVVGILHTGVAYAMYFGSIQRLPSQTVAVLSYIDPIVALLLSFAVLGESMSPLQLVGAVLIIGSAAVSEVNILEGRPRTFFKKGSWNSKNF